MDAGGNGHNQAENKAQHRAHQLETDLVFLRGVVHDHIYPHMPTRQKHIRCTNKNSCRSRKYDSLGLPNGRPPKYVAGQNHLTDHEHGKNQTKHGRGTAPAGQTLDYRNITIDHCADFLKNRTRKPMKRAASWVFKSFYSTASALSKSSLPPLTFSAKFL